MDVSIIIVNYNTEALTLEAVKSVLRFNDNLSFEIIVVDNGSKKSNLQTTLSEYNDVYYYSLKKNIGFGKANNFGYSKSNGNYIFLFNSDAYLTEPGSLLQMKNYLKSNIDVGIVGANLITADHKPNIAYGNFLTVERVLYNYGLKKVSKNYFDEFLATAKFCEFKIPTEVKHLTGAAIMIKKHLIEKLGLFDPAYFMYLEDMDLAYRYRESGYKSIILPSVNIVHIGGQSRKGDNVISKKIRRAIDYSSYLFLKKTTNTLIASILFYLGKIINFKRRTIKKIKLKISR